MGYGSYEIVGGELDGQWGGYNIEAICCEDGCNVTIDRGIDHMCGTNPHHGGDGTGCGKFFCCLHIHMIYMVMDHHVGNLCWSCTEACEHLDPGEADDCAICRGWLMRPTHIEGEPILEWVEWQREDRARSRA